MTSAPGSLRPASVQPRTLGDLAVAVSGSVDPADRDLPVTGVVLGSVDAQPGDLFVAVPGARSHGARYAQAALDAGAVAVLTDEAGLDLLRAEQTAVGEPSHQRPVPVVLLPTGSDPQRAAGAAAAFFYDHPSTALTSFGVTGTNGKTTTTYLLDHLLTALGRTVGLVGTVETRSGSRVLPSRLTTPDAASLQAVLATMREDGVDVLAMEVSSHSISQRRVDGLHFDVVGFTNLSQDHLDFHGDLDRYFAAKAELFTTERARRGVVVVDDEWGQRLAATADIPVVTLSVGRRGTPVGDWSVRDVQEGPAGTTFTVAHSDGRSMRVRTTLPGSFNIANAALALVMVVESGVDVGTVTAALEAAGGLSPAVPGRMEQVADRPRVVVDFAHNPDALALALEALRPTTAGRLVVVFGATGERDTTKRPVMGRIAVEGADVVVVTDDDPHAEEPAGIRTQVLDGAREAAAAALPGRDVDVLEAAPRALAIRAAVLAADDEDTVLVAGRGHEVWQEIDGVDHPLDDRVEARAAVADRAQRTTKEHSE